SPSSRCSTRATNRRKAAGPTPAAMATSPRVMTNRAPPEPPTPVPPPPETPARPVLPGVSRFRPPHRLAIVSPAGRCAPIRACQWEAVADGMRSMASNHPTPHQETHMKWYLSLLGALAVWRITHLLSAEAGPRRLLERLRHWAGETSSLACFYCLSLWVSVA